MQRHKILETPFAKSSSVTSPDPFPSITRSLEGRGWSPHLLHAGALRNHRPMRAVVVVVKAIAEEQKRIMILQKRAFSYVLCQSVL